MSDIDRIRFAHWVDVHEAAHVGIDSDALWRELEVLERADGLLPKMPAVGDTVQVWFCGLVATVRVTWVYGDGASFAATADFISLLVFTLNDLVPAEVDDPAAQ